MKIYQFKKITIVVYSAYTSAKNGIGKVFGGGFYITVNHKHTIQILPAL